MPTYIYHAILDSTYGHKCHDGEEDAHNLANDVLRTRSLPYA